MDPTFRARVRAGDEDAFAALFRAHGSAVYNHCFRLTGDWTGAEDCASLVFLEAWRQVLRRLLPVPGERDFPAGRRRQREDHLMTSVQYLSHRSQRDRRRAVGLGLPVAVATAAVGAVVAFGPSVSAPATGTPGSHPVPSNGAGGERRTSAVGYVLSTQPDDEIKITIHPSAAGTVDPARLQKDLADMGVQATVSRGLLTNRPQTTTLATLDRNGDYEALVSRRVPARIPQVILFPLGESTRQGWQAVDVLTVSVSSR
jgi:hypothetical protein